MPKRIVKSTTTTIGGTNYDAQIASATLEMDSAVQDVTNMDSDGWQEFLAGLKSWTFSVDFKKDADMSGLDSAMWTAFNDGTALALTIKGTSAATSTSNALYSGSIFINKWTPLTGAVGDVHGGSYSWQGTGAITRATA